MRNKDQILLEKALDKVMLKEYHSDEDTSVESQFRDMTEGDTQHIIEAMWLVAKYFNTKALQSGDSHTKELLRNTAYAVEKEGRELGAEKERRAANQ